MSIASSTPRSLPKVPKISRMCASLTLRVRWPTCRRVLVSPPAGPAGAAGAAAFFSAASVSMGRGLSAGPSPLERRGGAAAAARREGERPREGEREPLEREVPLLELVPEELEEPLELELPLAEEEPEDREAGMVVCASPPCGGSIRGVHTQALISGMAGPARQSPQHSVAQHSAAARAPMMAHLDSDVRAAGPVVRLLHTAPIASLGACQTAPGPLQNAILADHNATAARSGA